MPALINNMEQTLAASRYDKRAFLRRAMMDSGQSPWTRATMAVAPTVTNAASALAACTTTLTFLADQSKFAIDDMLNYWTYATNWLRPYNSISTSSGNNNDSATPTDYESWISGVFFDAMYDGQKICFKGLTQGTAYIWIVADGQFSSGTQYDFNASNGWICVDFGSATRRRVQLRHPSFACGFQSIAIEPTCALRRPLGSRTMQIYGDSQSAGTGSSNTGASWARIFGDFCGFDRCLVDGEGGTGYGAAGSHGTYATRVPKTLLSTADVVVFQGSINDASGSTTTQAIATWQAARAINPTALFLITGVVAGRSAGHTTVEGEIKTAFDSWPDANKLWIPCTTAVGGSHITGTGNTGATTGSGNSDKYIFTDGNHLNQAGHIYAAQCLYNETLGALQAAGS